MDDDFPAPPPPIAQSAALNNVDYQVRYDVYTGQPYYHRGFYEPLGPIAFYSRNQGDIDLREYQEFMTAEEDQYQSACELEQTVTAKIESLAETVEGLVATMHVVVSKLNDIQRRSRPPSVASSLVQAYEPRKQVQFDSAPQIIRNSPQSVSSTAWFKKPQFSDLIRRPDVPPPGFTTKPRMPSEPQHDDDQMAAAITMPPSFCPMAAAFTAPHTSSNHSFPPDACVTHGHMEQQCIPPHAHCVPQVMPQRHAIDDVVYRPTPVPAQQSMSRDQVRDGYRLEVLDYGRSEYTEIAFRPARAAGHHSSSALAGANWGISARQSTSSCATESSLVELLLFSTVSQQIKKLSGRDGIEKAKEYFREFEGLTRAWGDKQRIDLLGMKVIDSARLAFEAFETESSQTSFEDAKRAILDALSVEDNRKVGAWRDLKTLNQTDKETISEFGTRVKQTVRDAMSHMQSASQLEELNKKYFIDGLRDIGIRRTLAAQQERSRYTDLLRDGALIERSCPSETPKQPQAKATSAAAYSNRSCGPYQSNGGYISGYNGQRSYYGNENTGRGTGNHSYQQRPYAQNVHSNRCYERQNYECRQYNGSNRCQNWQENSALWQTSQNHSQPSNVIDENAVHQTQDFQFPRTPSRQGATNTGTTGRQLEAFFQGSM